MKSTKKAMKKQIKKTEKNNVFLIAGLTIILVIIIVLSLTVGNRKPPVELPFTTSTFEHVSSIGINEYKVSLNYDGTSIIFFCSNEKQGCYDELKALNEIAKEKELIIEYVNIDELVDSEKEDLKSTNEIFRESYYPVLVVIRNREVIEINNKYLSKEKIEKILKENKIIK